MDAENPLKLVRSVVTEERGQRIVEMVFADASDHDEAAQYVRLRVNVSPEGYVVVQEALQAALRRVRSAIGDEIRRIEDIAGRR